MLFLQANMAGMATRTPLPEPEALFSLTTPQSPGINTAPQANGVEAKVGWLPVCPSSGSDTS